MKHRRLYLLFALVLLLGVAVDVTLGKRYLSGDQATPEECYTCPIPTFSDKARGIDAQCADEQCAGRQSVTPRQGDSAN